jgi:putative transposase
MSTRPRFIRPRATYAISRLVLGQRFLLRPDSLVCALFTWVLAAAARLYDVEIHVAVVMSSHFHLVVTVPKENVSDFMHCLDSNLAKALQVLRKYRRTVIWTPGGPSIVELETPQAVVEQCAYAIANPVTAGLVYDAADWPGVTTKVSEIGTAVWRARMPGYYFDPKNPRWRQEEQLAITMPPCLRDLPMAEAHALIESEVERRQDAARAEVRLRGGSFAGAARAQRVSWLRCSKEPLKQGKLNPDIAAGRGQHEARKAAIARRKTFEAEHRDAKKRWCAGERSVVFPAGTYWMRVHHGVAVKPFP